MAFQMLPSFAHASKPQLPSDFFQKVVTEIPVNLTILTSFPASELISYVASGNRTMDMWGPLKQNKLEGMHTDNFQDILDHL